MSKMKTPRQLYVPITAIVAFGINISELKTARRTADRCHLYRRRTFWRIHRIT